MNKKVNFAELVGKALESAELAGMRSVVGYGRFLQQNEAFFTSAIF
ncbi:hypothetical protein [Pantoea rodasii]|nr:hypothetical protein [Pantoea rodasii]